MRIYLLKSDKIGSRIIRWGTKGIGSHMGVSFGGMFYDSYGFGLRKQTREKLVTNYEIVGIIEFPASPELNQKMNAVFMEQSYGVWYDYPALLYFIWRAALNRLFGMQYPKRNMWQRESKMLCTEVIELANSVYANETGFKILPPHIDLAMTSPSNLYTILLASKRNINNPSKLKVIK